jgi:two-component sensor histidine kinase
LAEINNFNAMQRHRQTESTGRTETLILAFIWIALLASPLIVLNGNEGLKWNVIFDAWLRIVPFLGLTLLNHFVLVPFLFFRKMRWYLVGGTLVLVLFSVSFSLSQNFRESRRPGPDRRGIVEDQWRPDPGRPNPPVPGSLPPYLNTFIVSLLVMGFDTGMRSIFRAAKTESEKEKLEKEKVKSELAFLRNQVSPHFFMNTLNNIHSLIDFDTEEAKSAVIRLSKLMQHLLYDSDKDTIPLKEEIAFIQSYIELMKLRINEKVKVNLNVQAEDSGVTIPPLLFTSLLENAFKYGVSYREKSFIDISLNAGDGKLVFKVSNSIIRQKNPERTAENSGIGLENTIKRLDLLYGATYRMDISDADGVYDVTLTIPL